MSGSRALFEFVERRASQNRSKIAIDFGSQCVTYGELLVRGQNLADQIVSHFKGRPSTVLLMCAKSPALFEAYLACCFLDATVVPVEPGLPDRRLSDIIELSGCAYSLRTGPDALAFDNGLPTSRWTQQEGWVCESGKAEARVASRQAVDCEAAYILFTSGSTGVPKGVPVSATNVMAYLNAYLPGVPPGGRFSQTFSISFDLSVHDIFVALGSAGTLCVPRGREQVHLSSYVRAREITRLFVVPSAVDVAARLGGLDPGSMEGLAVISLCGEALHWRQVAMLRAAAPNAVIENLYGPTEMTIACFRNVLGAGGSADSGTRTDAVVPIGIPLAGVQWDIRPEAEAGPGVGELLLRGPQRFGGYLDASLNRVAFQAAEQPASGDRVPPSWWYRSGDLVRVTPAAVEYLGRIDDQLKVLGHRIEPLEVESVFATHPLVTSAGIVKVASPTERLAAMYTGSFVDDRDLIEFLRARLPSYMVPEVFVHADVLPTNSNGKLDRKSIRRSLEGP